jgi:hypothetical protein
MIPGGTQGASEGRYLIVTTRLKSRPAINAIGSDLARTKFYSPDGTFTVTNPAHSALVNTTITNLEKALSNDPDCAAWLSTNDDVRMSGGLNSWLNNLMNSSGIGPTSAIPQSQLRRTRRGCQAICCSLTTEGDSLTEPGPLACCRATVASQASTLTPIVHG